MLGHQGSFYAGRRVWVAGHARPIGAALLKRLWREPCDVLLASDEQLDLLRQDAVERWVRRHRPQVVFLALDRSPAEGRETGPFARALYETLMASLNVLEAAFQTGVEVLVNLSSARLRLPDPHAAEASPAWRNGSWPAWPSEAVGRLAALRLTLCYVRRSTSRFIVPAPLHVYSPGDLDRLDDDGLDALVEGLVAAAASGAECVTLDARAIAGQGLIHVDDLADAAIFVAAHGTGDGLLRFGEASADDAEDLVRLIADVAGFRGRIEFAAPAPAPPAVDAAHDPRSAGALGWRPKRAAVDMARQIHADWVRRAAMTRRTGAH